MSDTETEVIPETLYHFTPMENLGSIMEHGLNSRYGNYFSSTFENCARLMALRLATSGGTEWVSIQISSEGLDVHRSNDHSATFFGTDDAWVTFETVSPDAIIEICRVSFEDPQ